MSENPIFSYTKRDYEATRQEGLAKIPILSKGAWTDLNATDPGIIILDYVHALVDMVNYYQDHQALETFITTAKERTNIFRLAKQLSYKVRSAKGATCDVKFTLPTESYTYTIKIPKYTSVSTKSGVKYLTTEDAYLAAGEIEVSVPCIQGVLSTINYRGTGISRFSNVPGAMNQRVRLVDNNIDIDSITIVEKVENRIMRVWNPVDYIVFSNNTDRVYQVDLNPDNSVTIKFGDGERGVVPETTENLSISYISSSAEDGRVGANSIVLLDNDIYDDYGNNIRFIVNNNLASTGGSLPQSSQEIRDLAPGVVKTQDRAVTLSDFEYLAKLVDGVADAKAYDINTNPDLCLYYEVKLLIFPKNPKDSLESLKRNVYNFISKRMLPPTNLQVLSPNYIPVNVNMSIKKLNNITEDRLRYDIERVVAQYFQEKSMNIGVPFDENDLKYTISRVEGVNSVLSLSSEITNKVGSMSILELGTLDIEIH